MAKDNLKIKDIPSALDKKELEKLEQDYQASINDLIEHLTKGINSQTSAFPMNMVYRIILMDIGFGIKLMPIIMRLLQFVLNGASIFRRAAKGEFEGESEAIRSLRTEMLSPTGSRFDDVQNMRRDRIMVGRDVRAGFNKIKRNE